MKYILLLLLFLSGCAIQHKPLPTKFCGKNETVNCIPMSPQDGAPGRGHGEEIKEQL